MSNQFDVLADDVTKLVGWDFVAYAMFDDAPEEKGFDWGKLLVNVLAGLAVVALVAAVIVTGGAALVAVGAVAATTVSAVATGAVIGGAIAVGFTAISDILSGEVSDISEYMFSGLSGAITGAISGGINLLKLGKFAKYGLEATEGFITGAIENVAYQMLVEDKDFDDINVRQVAVSSVRNGAIAIGTPVIGKIPFVKKLTDKLTDKLDDISKNSNWQNRNNWEYRPDDDLYFEYKNVYDNPKYYNQATGNINWPPNDGFVSKHNSMAKLGETFDRYGEPLGEYMSPKGTLYETRALAPHSSKSNYYQYEVIKPFDIVEGNAAPWFDEPGGGMQLYGVDETGDIMKISELLEGGFLGELR